MTSATLRGVEPRVFECPRCGAPLPRRAALVRVTCEYCKSEVVFERVAVKASEYRRTLEAYRSEGEADVELAGFRLRLLGRVAVGHSADVFTARRTTRLGERLILKVLRAAADEFLLRNELAVLQALADGSAPGVAHFSSLLPQPAFDGTLRGPRFTPTFAAAFRQPAGSTHTLAQLRRHFPSGVDPRHGVWIWRRSLELLDWVHRSGWAHGAILPEHVLLDAREHSVRLVGWSCAGHPGAPLVAVAPAQIDFYPLRDGNEPRLSFESDLSMVARSVLHALGGSATTVPAHVPTPLADLLRAHAQGAGGADALSVSSRVSVVAEQCFGPPKFVKLELT